MTQHPGVPIWVVYDHPRDFPSNYVARLWLNDKPTDNMMVSPDLDKLRREIWKRGASVKLMPAPGDDPVILETWL
jgi:hypothetical protein